MTTWRGMLVLGLALLAASGMAGAQRSGTASAVGAVALPARALFDIYFTVKGQKQGMLKGEGAGAEWATYLKGEGFAYEAKAPVTAAGMATGKLQHDPVVITRRVGAASPQLFAALTTNESLPEVVIKFVYGTREVQVIYIITLQNARLTRIRQFMGVAPSDGPPALHEEVAFWFQRITVQHPTANTEATADTGAAY